MNRSLKPQRIGLISDTHGLLRPEALEAMCECDSIIHAGDIGDPAVLEALREVAPVYAIRGNIDRGPWAASLPERLNLELGGVRIHVIHDVKQLRMDLADSSVAVVVCGHSHQPALQSVEGVLQVNPGSAGPRRFRLPIGVAYLHIAQSRARGELCMLG